jgi:hypothetical protein
MTATTNDRNTPAAYLQRQGRATLDTAAVVPAGVIVAVTAAGVVPTAGSSDAAGLTVLGRSEHSVDEAEGDTEIVYSRGVYGFVMSAALTSAAAANIGKTVFLDDNQTIGLASDTTNRIPVGKLELVGEDGLGYVSVGLDSGTVASTLSGSSVGTVANANTVGGIPVVHMFEIADAATADYDITLAEKTEFLFFQVIKTAGAGTAVTVQMKNTATAITDAIDIADADKTVSIAATIDDASNVIDAAGILRASVVRTTSGGGVKIACFGIKRA